MKLIYCKKYRNYVSMLHCETFNEGSDCRYYTKKKWQSIKELLKDPNRPKWEVERIVKPFSCDIMELREAGPVSARRARKRVS